MKQNYIKLLGLALCLLLSTSAFSDVTTTIDGISYSLDLSNRTAEVTGSTLAKVVVPATIVNDGITFTVTSIGGYAFFGINTITSFKSANTIKSIKVSAFEAASNLQKIDIGNALETIADDAFRNCTSLKYIVLPATIKMIGSFAFYRCPQLSIICLKQDFYNTGQTIHPSSFFTFSNSTFNYNGKVPEVDYTFNGIGNGFQPTEVNMGSLVKEAGAHSANLTCTFVNEDLTFTVDIPYNYTINPVTLTAKVKDAQRIYGDANPQFESTYSGFVNGEDASVITGHGTYTSTATAKSDVGTYTVKQTGATAQNYVFEYEDGTLTVNKAQLTMTANNKTMTYGSNVPTLDAAYTGLKNNESQPAWNTAPQITTTATKTSKVGNYPITISGADARNYELTVNSGILTVEKAALTVRAENKNRLYGDSNPEFTLSYSGLKNNETAPEWENVPVIETAATVKSSVGTYPITIKDAVAKNYDITATDGTLTINKASLKIAPKDATRKYGADNPNFELSYEGLKNNENAPEWTVAPVVTTTATKTSSVGAYNISVSSAEAKNYTIQKSTGTLNITKAPLQVSIKNYSRKYGESNPTFELSYTGLLNGETAPVWTTNPTIATEANTRSNTGEYAITATGGVMKNYETSTITPGLLTITPASLLIKANNASRLYYDDDPDLSYTCKGFIGSDNESVLTTKPTLQPTSDKKSSAGVYPIEISGAKTENYTITYEKGELTINKRELTVTTKDYTRAYGEENPEFELTFTGFVNNEDENILLVKPITTTEATTGTNTGVYDIRIGDGVAENYTFKYVGSKLTIEKAYQTLTWEQDLSDVKQYAQVELTAEATSGLPISYSIEGSAICSIIKIGDKQYLDCFGEGETVIVAVQEGNQNYWQTTKIYKTVLTSSAGVYSPEYDKENNVKIYDINGNRTESLRKGINILKQSDGTTKKLFVK